MDSNELHSESGSPEIMSEKALRDLSRNFASVFPPAEHDPNTPKYDL